MQLEGRPLGMLIGCSKLTADDFAKIQLGKIVASLRNVRDETMSCLTQELDR